MVVQYLYTLSFWFKPGNNTHENQNIFNAFSQYNTFEGTSIVRVMYNGNTGSTRNIRFNVQDQSGGLDKDNLLDLSTPVGDVTHTMVVMVSIMLFTCDGSTDAIHQQSWYQDLYQWCTPNTD